MSGSQFVCKKNTFSAMSVSSTFFFTEMNKNALGMHICMSIKVFYTIKRSVSKVHSVKRLKILCQWPLFVLWATTEAQHLERNLERLFFVQVVNPMERTLPSWDECCKSWQCNPGTLQHYRAETQGYHVNSADMKKCEIWVCVCVFGSVTDLLGHSIKKR